MIAVSIEGTADAAITQVAVPHLLLLADEQRGLSDAVALIHIDSKPGGGDSATPTTIVIDKSGVVRWLFRPSAIIERLSPDELLAAVDEHVVAVKR